MNPIGFDAFLLLLPHWSPEPVFAGSMVAAGGWLGGYWLWAAIGHVRSDQGRSWIPSDPGHDTYKNEWLALTVITMSSYV